MSDVTKGAVVGIGAGVKSHLTVIYTKGEKTFVRESFCGSVKTSGFHKSRTHTTDMVSEQSFDLIPEPGYTWGSETFEADRQAHWAAQSVNAKAHLQAMLSMADEFLALGNACSKCAKWVQEVTA